MAAMLHNDDIGSLLEEMGDSGTCTALRDGRALPLNWLREAREITPAE